MFLVSVVIPVYKSQPDVNEVKSFKQCLTVLFKHTVSLVCPKNLDISIYQSLASKCNKQIAIERFNDRYFSSIQSYSRLLLSLKFYKRYRDFDYILLYQLDAWVFQDELDYWCQKGYDYIGAPWFENYGSHEEGHELWTVGNGGFSLRRVPSFISILNYKKPLYKIAELRDLYRQEKTFNRKLRRMLVIYTKSTGLKNNIRYFINKYPNNEDWFWALLFQKSARSLKMPKCEEAIDFSFEKSPRYLYELNGRRLPFGCHAWEKYEYHTFWNNFIQEKE